MKRALPIIVVMLFLAGIFIVPTGVTLTPARLQETPLENETLEQKSELSWIPADKTVRIAVYNTTNSTEPSYVDGYMHLNNSWVIGVLTDAGYPVTEVDLQDIQNHELITANYDVLVLVDLVPNENITNLVKEFWLGGGGVLAFDTSGEFLNFAGILPHEAEGTNGRTTYWDYITEDDYTVSVRHPVTKSYQVDDALNHTNTNYFMWDWSALSVTTLANDLTVLVEDFDDSNNVKAIACNPSTLGGKTVHIGIPTANADTEWEPMIAEAVEWLCPRPKGRILFDLTHYPEYGVDEWDEPFVEYESKYGEWRNALVNRTYTFDKLWPSAAGNLTAENLDGYDMLIIDVPSINFTAAEVAAVTNWVNSGGSLLVLGTQYTYTDQRLNVNFLLGSYGLEWNSTTNENGGSNIFGLHPICEGLSLLHPVAGGVIDIQNPAVPLVTTEYDHIVAGAQNYGLGRVVMVSDIRIFDSDYITDNDNLQFAINIANWLTAGDVLVYATTAGGSTNPNKPSPYRGPIASALNNLGFSYLLTSNLVYFNLSLVTEDTELAIVDQASWDLTSPAYHNSLLDYLKADGKLIMSTWQMNAVSYPELIPLWDYLGVQYAGNTFSSPPTIYLWDDLHPIFNTPIDYNADNLTTTIDYCTVECTNLALHDNATAIAGLGTSQSTTNVSIILGANGRAITNGMLLTGHSEDTDDSTYADSIEIWQNEIAFLMRPTVDAPSDVEYELGDTGNVLTWDCDSDRPFEYEITRETVVVEEDTWDGGNRLINIDGEDVGVYTYVITLWDTSGSTESDVIVVTVVDTTLPEWIETPENLVLDYDMNWHYDVNATDLSGISTYFMNDTTNFDIDSTGYLTNNTFLDAGVYGLNISVEDNHGNVLFRIINITVSEEVVTTTTTTTDTTPTDTTPTSSTTPDPSDSGIIIIVIILGGVIIIIIIIMKKKKKS